MQFLRSSSALLLLTAVACNAPQQAPRSDRLDVDRATVDQRVRPQIYVPVKLTADLGVLHASDREMLPLLIGAAQIMDSLFWQEAWGAADSLPVQYPSLEQREFFRMNYGPWDRLEGDKPFLDNVGEKPKGARFYPPDMTVEEFEAWNDSSKKSLYTLVRRDSTGKLAAVPYHHYFSAAIGRAADLLESAAALATDAGFKRYLLARAQALRTDEYRASDLAWMDMRTNVLDLIIGPIETYEDQLLGYKASHEAYVVVKDTGWTRRLERFAQLLPALQRGLPVPAAYKKEKPGSDGQLGAYDVVYYAGACNAGGKTIAVNLPNDEAIQLQKGTRRLQLKNAMQAKFDKIVVPIANVLVAEDQRAHTTFDAFFQNVMFHEVAHGLGIKKTVNGKGTVREALLEEAGALEEGKADILGLWMVEHLREEGQITEGELMDNYVTFMASMFRAVRFGAGSAHGKASMLRFNYLQRAGAIRRDSTNGTWRVDPERMRGAVAGLSTRILTLQGNGDLPGLRVWMEEQSGMPGQLMEDLARVERARIPVDVVFRQGMDVLEGRKPAP